MTKKSPKLTLKNPRAEGHKAEEPRHRNPKGAQSQKNANQNFTTNEEKEWKKTIDKN